MTNRTGIVSRRMTGGFDFVELTDGTHVVMGKDGTEVSRHPSFDAMMTWISEQRRKRIAQQRGE